MTIARKLWLGLRVLILIFLVADLSILELDAVLKRWTSREEESAGGDGLEEPLDEVVLAGLRELGDAELHDVGASGDLGGAAELLGRLEKEFGRVRPALEAEAARDY
jgi:hypothetical protein